MLGDNTTINAKVYSEQLQRVHDSLVQKSPALVNRKGVILLHDNARPHIAKLVKQKIKELGWEVLPQPPYSPDIAPSDYYLFRSLQHQLAERRFENRDDIESEIKRFFDSKSTDFYRNGIEQLPRRWALIVEQGGEYIVD